MTRQRPPAPPGPAADADTCSRLIGHLGHDFNNLLGVVLGGLSLLREQIPAPEWSDDAAETYDDVVSAAREAADVLAQVTAWTGRQALAPAATDLGAVLRDLEPLVARFAGSGIEVAIEPPPAPAIAWVDAARLQQCVLALVANARDATAAGGTLRLAATASPRPALSVEDDGEGMSAEARARCLEPYFTTRRDRGHRGLGLSVVDGFARASGGALEVDSRPGAGTRVTLVLPASEGG